jgi:hypothetical protein
VAATMLENVTVEVPGMAPQLLAIGIDDEGLAVGSYGKVVWQGAQISVEIQQADACTVHLRAATGSYSALTIPASSLGGTTSVAGFAKWLQYGAAHSGATVVETPAPV